MYVYICIYINTYIYTSDAQAIFKAALTGNYEVIPYVLAGTGTFRLPLKEHLVSYAPLEDLTLTRFFKKKIKKLQIKGPHCDKQALNK